MDLKELGTKIAKYRLIKNISAYEFSLRIGKSHGYMHLVESGKVNISMKTFFEICEILEVPPKDLL